MKRPHAISAFLVLALCSALYVVSGASVQAQAPKPTLTLTDYSLFVDGMLQAERVGTMGGSLFWFSLPKQGLFILSPEPHEGYKFEKLAHVGGNNISFSLAGQFYQWTSTVPILSDNGEMEMWVLHDAEFQLTDCEKGLCFGSCSDFEYLLEHRKRGEAVAAQQKPTTNNR